MAIMEFSTKWIAPSQMASEIESVLLSAGQSIPLCNRDASLLLEASLMMQAGSPLTPFKDVTEGLMDASLVSDTAATGKVMKLGFTNEPYLTYLQLHVSPGTADGVLIIESAKALGDDLLIPLAFLKDGTQIFAVVQNYLLKRCSGKGRLHFLVAAPQEDQSKHVAKTLQQAFNHLSHILSSLASMLKMPAALAQPTLGRSGSAHFPAGATGNYAVN